MRSYEVPILVALFKESESRWRLEWNSSYDMSSLSVNVCDEWMPLLLSTNESLQSSKLSASDSDSMRIEWVGAHPQCCTVGLGYKYQGAISPVIKKWRLLFWGKLNLQNLIRHVHELLSVFLCSCRRLKHWAKLKQHKLTLSWRAFTKIDFTVAKQR